MQCNKEPVIRSLVGAGERRKVGRTAVAWRRGRCVEKVLTRCSMSSLTLTRCDPISLAVRVGRKKTPPW
jgi:hypothetical protein